MTRLLRSLTTPADALPWRIRVPLLLFFALSGMSDVLSAGNRADAPALTAAAASAVLCLAVLRTGIAAACFLPLLGGSVAWGTAPHLGLPVLVMIALVAATCTPPRVVAFVACCGIWALWSASGGLFTLASVTWALLPALGVAAVAGALIRSLTEKQRRDRREIDELTEKAARARAAERQRLAGELHDIVAHDLTMVVMLAELASVIDDEERRQEAITRIEHASRSALTDLRRLFGVLERDALAGAGQAAATSGEPLADVRESISALRELGFGVSVRAEGDASWVDGPLRLALRRSLREALSNVARHGAPGGQVRIDYLVTGEQVVMGVSSTVPPGSRSRGPGEGGTGLIHMREQAEALGGSFRAGITGGVWRVELVLPCEPPGWESPAPVPARTGPGCACFRSVLRRQAARHRSP